MQHIKKIPIKLFHHTKYAEVPHITNFAPQVYGQQCLELVHLKFTAAKQGS